MCWVREILLGCRGELLLIRVMLEVECVIGRWKWLFFLGRLVGVRLIVLVFVCWKFEFVVL